jgi:hypothetical protein
MAKFTHGYRHNRDMNKNREKDMTARDRDTNG